jgi:hypothetical protein
MVFPQLPAPSRFTGKLAKLTPIIDGPQLSTEDARQPIATEQNNRPATRRTVQRTSNQSVRERTLVALLRQVAALAEK